MKERTLRGGLPAVRAHLHEHGLAHQLGVGHVVEQHVGEQVRGLEELLRGHLELLEEGGERRVRGREHGERLERAVAVARAALEGAHEVGRLQRLHEGGQARDARGDGGDVRRRPQHVVDQVHHAVLRQDVAAPHVRAEGAVRGEDAVLDHHLEEAAGEEVRLGEPVVVRLLPVELLDDHAQAVEGGVRERRHEAGAVALEEALGGERLGAHVVQQDGREQAAALLGEQVRHLAHAERLGRAQEGVVRGREQRELRVRRGERAGESGGVDGRGEDRELGRLLDDVEHRRGRRRRLAEEVGGAGEALRELRLGAAARVGHVAEVPLVAAVEQVLPAADEPGVGGPGRARLRARAGRRRRLRILEYRLAAAETLLQRVRVVVPHLLRARARRREREQRDRRPRERGRPRHSSALPFSPLAPASGLSRTRDAPCAQPKATNADANARTQRQKASRSDARREPPRSFSAKEEGKKKSSSWFF